MSDQTQASVAPLSAFMWRVPKRRVLTPGCAEGTVGDLRNWIADLSVNFEVIVKELAHPYEHPVYDIFQKHPLHTAALNKRQFDVLRYGVVLNAAQRLVMVAAPPDCADAGARIDTEYRAIFQTRMDRTETSLHPLLPEYSLIVMRLPKDGADRDSVPELLFRLVFRNEAYTEPRQPLVEMCASFPLFRLRSVMVPSACYAKMDEVYRYRSGNPAFFRTEAGKVLPNPRIEQMLRSPPIGELCDAWVHVVNGIAPAWVQEKGLGPDVVGLFLKTHRRTSRNGIQGDGPVEDPTPVLDNRVRLSYSQNAARMERRVRVMTREPGLISRWRDGEFDVPTYTTTTAGVAEARKGGVPAPLTEPQLAAAPCARMLMRLTRGAQNDLQDGEICAYIPEEHEYAEQHVYRTRAAEKLRLWVLKGLMTAELHNVHAVLLEVDPRQLLAQCVGLLHGEENDDGSLAAPEPLVERKREAIFHVCKIVVETVEDYVQHSGVIWQVTLAVMEDGNDSRATGLCQDILRLTQRAKARVEEQERARFENPNADDDAYDEPADARGEQATGLARAASQTAGSAAPGGVPAGAATGAGALVVWAEGDAVLATLGKSGIPPIVAERAAVVGYELRDDILFPLFESLCEGRAGTVPVKSLVHILLDKLDPSSRKSRRGIFWPMDNPLLNLDNCGIPCSERSVTNFVMGFCLKPYSSASRGGTKPQQRQEHELALNYVEFSMMMLALAQQ